MQPISLSSTSALTQQWSRDIARISRRASRIIGRNPLLLKALPTAGGYAFGDCLTQQLGPLWPADWPTKHDPSKHDFTKTVLMGGVGAALGAPISLALYAWMNSVAPGTGYVLNAAKFAADQVVGCVLWQAAYMCISKPYRRSFIAFAAAQGQQQLDSGAVSPCVSSVTVAC